MILTVSSYYISYDDNLTVDYWQGRWLLGLVLRFLGLVNQALFFICRRVKYLVMSVIHKVNCHYADDYGCHGDFDIRHGDN